ncbi:MAG: hypothetical protein CMA86_00170 [Euryarchaeota archaeon]|nr:hypothetical protein [Euryarchaeota archaeon]
MSNDGPRSAVFTTMLVNEQGELADWPLHQERLLRHAQRLRIQLPGHPPEMTKNGPAWQLVRVGCQAGSNDWEIESRPITIRNENIEAISYPAPRWNARTNGTKHGDWQAYREALTVAERAGCDAALLVHDFCIVDGDRATPLVLDEDGTVWMAHDDEGGVDGITATYLAKHLPSFGLPVMKGKLNERTVARCSEMVLVGTGMGACRVDSLDGEVLGSSTVLSEACQELLHQHFTERSTWSTLGQRRV